MPYKFSPSSLSLLKDCPRCFWLKFNKNITRPESIFPSLPSGMDKILKEHFDRFMKKGEIKKFPYLVIQWVLFPLFSPIISAFLSSLPALESHTRLLLGKKLNYKVTQKI